MRLESIVTITVAADGSSLGNPGPAGWAWFVDDTCWGAGGWKRATNNVAELTAVLEFLRATSHLTEDVLFLCDSQYVINCLTTWLPGWKRKGWRKADGKPVLNRELLEELDGALAGRSCRFEWVKGHANHPLNEAADERARAVAEAFAAGSPPPTGPGWALGHPLLFEIAEPKTMTLTLTLSDDEHAELRALARASGRSPEAFVRALLETELHSRREG